MRTTVLNLNLKDVLNHTLNNKLFNYYISIITKDIEMLENDVPVVLHNDFYDYIFTFSNCHKKITAAPR